MLTACNNSSESPVLLANILVLFQVFKTYVIHVITTICQRYRRKTSGVKQGGLGGFSFKRNWWQQ